VGVVFEKRARGDNIPYRSGFISFKWDVVMAWNKIRNESVNVIIRISGIN
jgi:hypothetical protein